MYNVNNIVSYSIEHHDHPEVVVDEILECINKILDNQSLPRILHYKDPIHMDSNTYSFIFSTDELSEEEVGKISEDIWGEACDEEEED